MHLVLVGTIGVARIRLRQERLFQAKGISDAVKECKQGNDVNGLGYLGVGPASVPEAMGLAVGHQVRGPCEYLGKLQQRPLPGRKRSCR